MTAKVTSAPDAHDAVESICAAAAEFLSRPGSYLAESALLKTIAILLHPDGTSHLSSGHKDVLCRFVGRSMVNEQILKELDEEQEAVLDQLLYAIVNDIRMTCAAERSTANRRVVTLDSRDSPPPAPILASTWSRILRGCLEAVELSDAWRDLRAIFEAAELSVRGRSGLRGSDSLTAYLSSLDACISGSAASGLGGVVAGLLPGLLSRWVLGAGAVDRLGAASTPPNVTEQCRLLEKDLRGPMVELSRWKPRCSLEIGQDLYLIASDSSDRLAIFGRIPRDARELRVAKAAFPLLPLNALPWARIVEARSAVGVLDTLAMLTGADHISFSAQAQDPSRV